MLVSPDDPERYAAVERCVRQGVENHFRNVIRRPELLNRLGESIVVFDFIRPPVDQEIFDKAVRNVFDRVARTLNLNLSFAPESRQKLLEICTRRPENGGRGIGNKLEQALVNPLARALFLERPTASEVTIADVIEEDGKYSVRLA